MLVKLSLQQPQYSCKEVKSFKVASRLSKPAIVFHDFVFSRSFCIALYNNPCSNSLNPFRLFFVMMLSYRKSKCDVIIRFPWNLICWHVTLLLLHLTSIFSKSIPHKFLNNLMFPFLDAWFLRVLSKCIYLQRLVCFASSFLCTRKKKLQDHFFNLDKDSVWAKGCTMFEQILFHKYQSNDILATVLKSCYLKGICVALNGMEHLLSRVMEDFPEKAASNNLKNNSNDDQILSAFMSYCNDNYL